MKKLTLFIAMLFCAAFNYSAQAIESHTVACTAGNLAIVTAGYKATVTNLTVTGTIDARDFKTMQNAMPLLDTIDLSGSTVEAYLGAQGTNGTTFTDYPANAIPPFAFHNLSTHASKTSLKSFVYPSSITTIGVYAFLGCSGFIGSLIIPSSVTTIGECAFMDCSGFTGSLSIPSSVTTIGGSAFYACSGLTGSLTIPSSVTTIGSYAFHSCSGFTSITALPTTPINIIGSSDVFYNINKTTCILHVPVGSKSLYAAADQWKDFINIVEETATPFPAPTVTSVAVPSNGTYVAGQNLDLTVNYSEAITVVGTPYIPVVLATGTVNASYVSGSGTTALVFRYTVAAGDADNDGISVGSAITLNGGTLKNGSSVDAILTLNSVASTTGIKVDTDAPSAPSTPDLLATSDSGTSSSDNITNHATPTVTGTAEAIATVTIFDTDGTTVLGTTTANGLGNWTITSTTLSEGVHSITAKATDAAGNTGSASSGLSITIDVSAPAAPGVPDLSAGSDSGVSSTDNITNIDSPTFSGTVEANATVTIYDTNGTTVLGTTTADGSGNWTITSTILSELAHSIKAKATDLAGNTSSVSSGLSIKIDKTRPTLASSITISDTALKIGDTATLTFAFTEAVAGFTIADLNAPNGTVSSLSSSDGGITWTATLTPSASSTAAFNVITLDYTGITDLAGNAGSGSATSGNYTVDTARPTATIVVADNALSVGETSLVTFTFSEAVSGFITADLTVPNGVVSSLSSGDGGITWTATLTPSAATTAASNVIILDYTGIVDLAGNVGTGTATSGNYAIDTVSPTIPNVTSSTLNGTYKLSDVVAITVTFSEAVTVTGTPTLGLNSGGTASYILGSGTTVLTFNYTIGSGQSIADLDYSATSSLALSGGTIKDVAGNDATLTLPTVGGPSSIGGQKDIVIGIVPIVTTSAVTSIGGTTATGNGNITDLGFPNPTQYGVVWSTSTNPTVALSTKTTQGGASVMGAFPSGMMGLTKGTTYYVKAYATNSVGTSYGNEVSFTTAIFEGLGTDLNPYQIATLADLRLLSENSSMWNKSFIQTADIDASTTSSWNSSTGFSPIGNGTTKFTGKYNGQQHIVSGLFINRPGTDFVGLFGWVTTATIQNLGLINVNIKGSNYAGGLAGSIRASSTISNCFSTGTVTGNILVAGITGSSESSTITNSYSKVNVTGNDYVAGLVGYNFRTIASPINPIEINCYSSGTVSGVTHLGGLNSNNDGIVTNCFWDTQTSGRATSVGGTGKTTIEMNAQSTFTGWDFTGETANGTNDYWSIDATKNNGYPYLSWQILSSTATIATTSVSTFNSTTATLGGNITTDGGATVTERGVVYSLTDATPTIAEGATKVVIGSGAGIFSQSVGSLNAGTLYYVNAYAINSEGISYGTATSFTTLIPSITSSAYNATTGILSLTCLNISAGETIDPAKITLTGEGGSTYTLTTGTVTASSFTSASITLNAADLNAVNMMLNKNGVASTSGTTYNLAAADDWDASVTSANSADAINSFTVSNVSVPSITSATYDAATGTLVVTGTGFLKLNGATNDIDVSKLTLSGQGGATYTLTTASVEIASGTAFTVTLNATDYSGVNQILNKNGTSSAGGTTYNLAAAEDWEAGADAAVVVADLTGNGITVSNATEAPAVQASSIAFSAVQPTAMTISWSNGNGSYRAVFIKQANTGTVTPADNSTYTANTAFGSGTQILASSWYCIYNGTGTTVTVTGLAIGTDYIVQVFEYNGTAGIEKYFTATATNNPKSQASLNCLNPTSGGTIAADQSGCYPFDPATILSAVPPTGHAGTLDYKWQSSTTGNSSGFSDIPSSNAPTYNPAAITVDTWFKRIARVTCVSNWTGAAESNVVKMTVNTLPAAPLAGSNSYVYDGTEKTAVAGVGLDETTDWYIASNGGSTVPAPSFTNAGTYTAYAETKKTTTGCTSADRTLVTLRIAKKALSVTAEDKSKTFDGAVFSPFTVSYSGFVPGETAAVLGGSLSFGGNAASAVGAGTYTIIPIGLTSGNYNITFVPGKLDITKRVLTITADYQSKAFDGKVFSPFTVSYSGFVQGDTPAVLGGSLSFGGTAATAVNAGTNYVITPKGLTSETYDIIFVPGKLDITKKALTITADNQSKAYDGKVFSPFTLSYSGLGSGEAAALNGSPTFSGTAATAVNAGTNYVIIPGGLTSGNYDITFVPGKLDITKKALTISADDKNKCYDGAVFSGSNTISANGLATGENLSSLSGTLTFSGTANGAVNIGSYTIVPGGLTSDNYAITFRNGTLNINSLPVPTITGAGTVCAKSEKVVYTTEPGMSGYKWATTGTVSQGAASNAVEVTWNVAGPNRVEVNYTSPNGCSAKSPVLKNVTVNPLPGNAGTITGTAEICAGTQSVVYSTPVIPDAGSYVWTLPAGATVAGGNGTTNLIVNYTAGAASGNISVYGKNLCGSGEASPAFPVAVHPVPAAPVITAEGNVLKSSAPDGNQWYFQNMLIPGVNNSTCQATHAGKYWANVVINGCQSDNSNSIEVADEADSNIGIYPIPCQGKFTASINTSSPETMTISVFTKLGKKIYELTNVTVFGDFQTDIDLGPVPSGIYVVEFKNGSHKITRKVLVNK